MGTLNIVYYQENNKLIGWVKKYPDYRTQGIILEELKENLYDIFQDIGSGKIPYITKNTHK